MEKEYNVIYGPKGPYITLLSFIFAKLKDENHLLKLILMGGYMRLLVSLVFVFIALSMSGCKLLQVKGEVGGVEVEAQTKENRDESEGKFCPPGQAKKGNC